jgi:hypothetical protein
LPSAIFITNPHINQHTSEFSYSEIKPNNLASEIWNLSNIKEVCLFWNAQLKNGDLLFLGNKDGEKELREIAYNPEIIIEKMKTAIGKNIFPTVETKNSREFYSSKILPAMEWCLANVHQVNMFDYTLYQNFNDIKQHMTEVGTSGEIDTDVCYKLAYPHYSGMVHVCRYLNSKFVYIREVVRLNRGLYEIVKNKYALNLDLRRMYDNFLMTLWAIDKSEKLCLSEKIGEDTENYRFITKDGALFGSVLLLGFISKNYEEIYSNPHQRGWLFEDFVEKELIERQAIIVKRNFETPKGEIDFICTKGERIFVIEAKDYGPWFDSDYISSRTYSERINAINERLTKAPPRLKWIELNRKPLGLSMSKKIQGLVITRLHEPHLKIPVGFEYVNVDELDLIFGKSKKAKSQVIKRKFRFGKESLLELEKELLNENEKAYMQFGLR